jgi:hypothetical protein
VVFRVYSQTSSSQKENGTKNQLPKNPPNPPLPPLPKEDKPPTPEENSECPYNEQSIIFFFDTNSYFSSQKEKELAKWRKIPQDFITNL